jgi:biotin-(acetyl-CoA carboxylase) ligase
MPLDAGNRINTPFAAVLDLPPPFRAIGLREVGDAFAHAVKIAPDAGAGTLVHVGRFDLVEFAVVLEPDEPLRTARRALYAGLTALADALAAHAPPEKPISFDWPASIRIDCGLVGGANLGWPARADEDATPPWLVFGAMVHTVAIGEEVSGLHPHASALDAEGFADLGSGRLIESFARHLMATIDAWQQEGFAGVAKRYVSRLAPERGAQRNLDDNGDLLVQWPGKIAAERRALIPALATLAWLDPAIKGPRL